MERLTIKEFESTECEPYVLGGIEYYGDSYGGEVIDKLAAYEDLQEMIGIPFEKFAELCKEAIPNDCKNPSKAIILTDESVDEWQQYKADKEQGLLLRLPYPIGSTVWFVGNGYVNDYEVRRYIVDETGIVCVQVAKILTE